jgi:cytochrome b involved in lipid metabolism
MEMVESGHQVAVIDDLVVDMEKYYFYHPGGKFVLSQNVGRDISKYFHGAFSLENMGANKVYNWYHST